MMEIYNCDFREQLGHKIDMVITDPPYNIGFNYSRYTDTLSSDDYVEMLSYLNHFKSAIIGYAEQSIGYYSLAFGMPDYCLSWCYNSNIPKQFRLVNFYGLTPDLTKDFQPYKNPTDKRVKKLIEGGREGARMYSWFSDIQLVKNVSKEKTEHPCPIPEKLVERIIKLSNLPLGSVIFDPFMGSGTVGRVALDMGYDFIGCEIDNNYFEIAKRRLDANGSR